GAPGTGGGARAGSRGVIGRAARLEGRPVRAAEDARLANGPSGWLRVAGYWRGSGLLWPGQQRAGAAECVAASDAYPAPACRSFVVDTPWSAAFVSWVMRRAALPGFGASASHVDYVRAAYRDPDGSPYRIVDPHAARPARGDLLCYVRVPGRNYGFSGLATLLSTQDS